MARWFSRNTLLLLVLSAIPAHAEAPKDGYFLHFDRAGNMRGLFRPGLPGADPGEIRDAFAHFTDREAALNAIQEIRKRAKAPEKDGGSLFAVFENRASGNLRLTCGFTASAIDDPDKVRRHADTSVQVDGLGEYDNLRYSSREERVRLIARCLSGLESMPKLKPARREIKHLYIDDASYALGIAYVRARDPKGYAGSDGQYRKAFRCLVTAAGRELPEAVGDTVVLQQEGDSADDLTEVFNGGGDERRVKAKLRLSVTFEKAASRILDSFDHAQGIWPSYYGAGGRGLIVDGNAGAVEQILRAAKRHLPECRRYAGLFETPPSRVEVPSTQPICNE